MSQITASETSPALRASPRLKQAAMLGLRRGVRGTIWIARILVPVSLAVALLDWTGWLYALDPVFSPVMALINLPPQAALPLLSALFSSFYTAVAMMLVIPFTHAQFILMAIFISIAHMIVVEGLIQHKAGMHAAAITAIRLAAAGITVYMASLFLTGTEAPVVLPDTLGQQAPILDVLATWALATLELMLKLLVLMVFVMVLIEAMTEFGFTERVAKLFRPFMAVMGLSPNVATMWVAGTFFGIVCGAAVIVDESASGRYSRDELRRLHMSLGICHSMIEDPVLFLALGIGLQWTVLPRLVAAILTVQLYRLSRAVLVRLRPSRS